MSERINTIDDVALVCYNLVKKLHDQPPTNGHIIHNPSKVLCVESYHIAKVTEIMTERARAILQDRYLIIMSSPESTPRIFYPLYSGINSEWLLKDEVLLCFTSIIGDLKSGWKKSSLEEHPELSYQRKDPNLLVFDKKNNVYDTDRLIRFLVGVLYGPGGFHRRCDCSCYVLGDDGLHRPGKFLVLFVHKDHLEEIDTFFNFGLSSL